MKTPMVSVVITNYNYGKYLREAINSVLHQTYENLEIILIDDASTDNSQEVYNEFRDKMKIVEHEENRGIVFSRNEAIDISRGEYLTFLDADDYWDEDYIEKSLMVAREFDADVIYPNWRLFGDEIREHTMNFAEFAPQLLQLQTIHCTAESLVRKSAIGNHRFESEKVAEDWDFFIGLSLDGAKFKLAKDNFIHYRQKAGSRGTKNDEIEDVKYFVEILQKWRRIYGDKVIDPSELVLAKLKPAIDARKDLARSLVDAIAIIEKLRAELDETISENENMAKTINDLINSRTYKVGKIIAKPVHGVRKILNKNR